MRGAGDAKRNLALLASRGALHLLGGAFELREDGARIVEHCAAGIGQLDAARLAAEQLHIELALERLDLLAERRLLHAEPLGRPGDVALLGDRDEIAKMT